MKVLYHRLCTSVNRERNILKTIQSAKWQTRVISDFAPPHVIATAIAHITYYNSSPIAIGDGFDIITDDMKANIKGIVIIAGLLALAGFGAGVYFLSGDGEIKDKGRTLVVRKSPKIKLTGNGQKRTLIRVKDKEGEEKPNMFKFDNSEEDSLSPEMKQLLADLQAELDADNGKGVAKIAEKILVEMRKNGNNVPPIVRSKAIEALGWFLPDSVSDLVPFLADSDPGVLEDALTQFDSALDDPALSDRELSEIIKICSKVIKDEDALESMFMTIETGMRNSVAISTYKYVMENGTPEAKARIASSIDDFTGEEGISTKEGLDEWYKQEGNQDDEDDEEFYAGEKD